MKQEDAKRDTLIITTDPASGFIIDLSKGEVAASRNTVQRNILSTNRNRWPPNDIPQGWKVLPDVGTVPDEKESTKVRFDAVMSAKPITFDLKAPSKATEIQDDIGNKYDVTVKVVTDAGLNFVDVLIKSQKKPERILYYRLAEEMKKLLEPTTILMSAEGKPVAASQVVAYANANEFQAEISYRLFFVGETPPDAVRLNLAGRERRKSSFSMTLPPMKK